ncbi:MAG: hypothetical protein HZB16_13550, partial [Armatimonadetes bacterium]|nr:hypothetical protein [Armatimonadota bacterium]
MPSRCLRRSALPGLLALVAACAGALTLDFEQNVGGFVTLAEKQPMRLVADQAHGGKQSLYSGPPGATGCMSLKLAKPVIGRVECWFYDDLAPAKRQTVSVSDVGDEYLLFVAGTPTVYQARIGMTYTDTRVKRTLGWHRISFLLDGRRTALSIDGEQVMVNERLRRLDSIMLGSPWDASTGWYDDLTIEPRDLSDAELAAIDAADRAERAAARQARIGALTADRSRLSGELKAATYGHLGATTPLAEEYHRRL